MNHVSLFSDHSPPHFITFYHILSLALILIRKSFRHNLTTFYHIFWKNQAPEHDSICRQGYAILQCRLKSASKWLLSRGKRDHWAVEQVPRGERASQNTKVMFSLHCGQYKGCSHTFQMTFRAEALVEYYLFNMLAHKFFCPLLKKGGYRNFCSFFHISRGPVGYDVWWETDGSDLKMV